MLKLNVKLLIDPPPQKKMTLAHRQIGIDVPGYPAELQPCRNNFMSLVSRTFFVKAL